jgi:hypothetical protein
MGERGMPGFKGGCLCGAIRYEVSGEPVDMRNCHCDDCRRATGASFSTNIFVKLEDLAVITGTTSTFQHRADSGNTMTKEFCSTCGSQLFNHSSGRPTVRVVRVGSIDDAWFVRPRANLYCSKALPFTHLAEGVERFERMPT